MAVASDVEFVSQRRRSSRMLEAACRATASVCISMSPLPAVHRFARGIVIFVREEVNDAVVIHFESRERELVSVSIILLSVTRRLEEQKE